MHVCIIGICYIISLYTISRINYIIRVINIIYIVPFLCIIYLIDMISFIPFIWLIIRLNHSIIKGTIPLLRSCLVCSIIRLCYIACFCVLIIALVTHVIILLYRLSLITIIIGIFRIIVFLCVIRI